MLADTKSLGKIIYLCDSKRFGKMAGKSEDDDDRMLKRLKINQSEANEDLNHNRSCTSDCEIECH